MSVPIPHTPLTFVRRPGTGKNRHVLTLDEIELNRALARQWRIDNPEFFAIAPATLPPRNPPGRKAPHRSAGA